MRWTLLAPVLAIVFAACGAHPPTSPSSTSPAPAGSSSAPTVAIDVKADAAGSRDAIASLSEVIIDASGSTGTGLTYAIDFGDGAAATGATAKHVYAAPASYTITATVTDSQGRKASSTKQIAVRDVTGSWFQAGYVEKTKRVEVRRLTLTVQDGLTVHGTYQIDKLAPRGISGTLTTPRHLHLVADGGAVLDGDVPSQLGDDLQAIVLAAQGDSIDGPLTFQPILGEPTGAAPSAILNLSFDGGGVFGRPIASLTPVRFDATASRGTGLAYFIEFGDGAMTTSAQATRVVGDTRNMFEAARLTVVDGFGRSDTDAVQYITFNLIGVLATWSTPENDLGFQFTREDGVNYAGQTWGCYLAAPTPCGAYYGQAATAAMSGIRDVAITVPGRGFTLHGTIATDGTIQGVDQSGKTWRLFFREE